MINKKYYFLSTGLFAVLTVAIMKKLDIFLRKYEADQPDTYANKVFRYFFKESLCFSLIETSTGLSGNKKYFIMYKASPIGFFIIEPSETEKKEAAKWQLKELEILSSHILKTIDCSRMSDEQKAVAFGALHSRAEYMINTKGAIETLSSYYDKNASAYSELVEIGRELWMNEDEGHTFHSEELCEYISYSNHLFSVRVLSTMNAYCSNDDSYRDFKMDLTMFFYKKKGQWLCFETTNA